MQTETICVRTQTHCFAHDLSLRLASQIIYARHITTHWLRHIGSDTLAQSVSVCACVRACVRVCVRACVRYTEQPIYDFAFMVLNKACMYRSQYKRN